MLKAERISRSTYHAQMAMAVCRVPGDVGSWFAQMWGGGLVVAMGEQSKVERGGRKDRRHEPLYPDTLLLFRTFV